MPVAQKILFVCSKCGFKSYRTVGDQFPDPNDLKPCPKCGAHMKRHEGDTGVMDEVVGGLGSLMDGVFGKK